MAFVDQHGSPWPHYAERVASAIVSLVEVVLVVDDIERSVRFYRDTLGLEVISPATVAAVFLRVGAPMGGIPQQIVLVPRAPTMPAATGRRLHHIGLAVPPDAYETERARLSAAGVALRGGQHPFLPVDAFYLDDPDGNEIEIATWRG
jgi:catechol 2,3-dioxygenase